MPTAMATLLEKVERIENLLSNGVLSSAEEKDKWFNVEDLQEYHPNHPAKATIYDWVCQRRIPYHKDGKKLRFLKSEIDSWLMSSYHKTDEEMQNEAIDYVNGKRGGKK